MTDAKSIGILTVNLLIIGVFVTGLSVVEQSHDALRQTVRARDESVAGRESGPEPERKREPNSREGKT